MSDGGENVRRVQECLHPFSEHLIDWFYMRLTVLQHKRRLSRSNRLDSVKHLLWHGNVAEALQRLDSLVLDLSLIQARSAPAKTLARGLAEFEIYIRNNREFIPNFGETNCSVAGIQSSDRNRK